MKLKYDFVINKVADKIVAVAVGDDLEKFNGFIKMNDITAFVFELLKNDVTEEEIIEAMKKEYADASEEEIKETVADLLSKLKDGGLID